MIPQEFLDQWLIDNKLTLDKVNNGNCEDFANDAIVFFDNADIVGTDNFVDWLTTDLGGHIWIMHSGRHYDCDSLSGVDNWQELKFFNDSP